MKPQGPQDWGSLAARFDESVCHVLTDEREGRVVAMLRSAIRNRHRVAEFGCGTGRNLPLLSELAREVDAYDFAPSLIEIAERSTARAGNVTCAVADLSREDIELTEVDVGVCVNVLLSPSADLRERILATIARTVRSRGRLVLVVPSVESALLTVHRQIEHNRRSGWPDREARAAADVSDFTIAGVRDGVLMRAGARTKHYLREELIILLESHRWRVDAIAKAEYDWTTELENPPRWMRAPYPWDWAVLATRG